MIVFVNSEKKWEEDEVISHFPDQNIKFAHTEDLMTDKDSLQEMEVLSVFVHTNVTKKLIDSYPNLKLIVTRSTGYDHIDVLAAKDKNVIVCNVPSYGENTVAEHAFSLLLAIARRTDVICQRTKCYNFDYLDMPGFDLQNKTIGIVGAGKIGMHAIRIARGFGMKVIAFDIYRNEFLADALGFEYVKLEDLWQNSDIISLHTPYNQHTHHLVNEGTIDKFKEGVILINTARGSVVSNKALLKGLKNGKIAFAGIDVVEDENEIFNFTENTQLKEIIDQPNLIFTPHSAHYTLEAGKRRFNTALEDIKSYFDGKIINQVN